MRKLACVVLALLAVPSCVTEVRPTRVASGLESDLPVAQLADADMQRLCGAWVDYAELALDGRGWAHDSCTLLALDQPTPTACIEARTRCEEELGDVCADAHAVPDCDPALTVTEYERCGTAFIDGMAAADLGCAIAGDEAAVRAARARALVSPAGCELLNTRACALFAPSSAP